MQDKYFLEQEIHDDITRVITTKNKHLTLQERIYNLREYYIKRIDETIQQAIDLNSQV